MLDTSSSRWEFEVTICITASRDLSDLFLWMRSTWRRWEKVRMKFRLPLLKGIPDLFACGARSKVCRCSRVVFKNCETTNETHSVFERILLTSVIVASWKTVIVGMKDVLESTFSPPPCQYAAYTFPAPGSAHSAAVPYWQHYAQYPHATTKAKPRRDAWQNPAPTAEAQHWRRLPTPSHCNKHPLLLLLSSSNTHSIRQTHSLAHDTPRTLHSR